MLVSGFCIEAELVDMKGWVEIEILLKQVRHEGMIMATVLGAWCFKAASVEMDTIKWGEDSGQNGFLLKESIESGRCIKLQELSST